MTTIVVTGGVGYVGRELVRQLGQVQPDAALHVIDNLDSGADRLAAMNQDSFTLHRVDIRDRQSVGSAIDAIRPDVIYHLAAVHFIPQCERDPGDAVARNVLGTVNLLDAAPSGARFVLASTAAVYAPEPDAHNELSSAIGPMDIYGWTKLQGEQYVRYYHETGKIDGAVVRLFNVVGSGETNPHLAPAIIAQLHDGNTSIKLGNQFPERDYIDVRDAAEGFRRIAAARQSDGSLTLTNLGTGISHSVGTMVRSIADAAGVDLTIETEAARVRAVDRPMLKASITRLEAITGWRPGISLSDAMRSAWATRIEDRLQ